MLLRSLVTLLFAGCAACITTAQVQVADLSTGVASDGSLIAPGQDDDDWLLEDGPDGGSHPRPATVVQAPGNWRVIPGTRWISVKADYTGPVGLYVYEVSFQLRPNSTNPRLLGAARSDNEASVYLNDVLIATLDSHSYEAPNPTDISTSDGALFRDGSNVLRFEVVEQGGYTGVDVVGEVQVDGQPTPRDTADTSERMQSIAPILRVPDDYPTIQAAIDTAVDGGTVIVAAGTYPERITFRGRNIVVRSSDGADVTIIDGGRSGSVVTFNGAESLACVLQGFTITNGLALQGGGVYCAGSSPTIRQCVISENVATNALQGGGGIYCRDSAALIIDTTVSQNVAADWGGGVLFDYPCTATLKDTIVMSNSSWQGGGVLCADDSAPTVVHNAIFGNDAGDNGGGVYLSWRSSAVIDSNTIRDNRCAHAGAGMIIFTPDAVIINNLIAENESLDHGGGVLCWGASALTNNTVFENTAPLGGGIMAADGITPLVTNCIIWGNSPEQMWGTPTVSYSDVEGGWTGEQNIAEDPLLTDPRNGDFHIAPGSPCVDSGTNLAVGLPDHDFEGDNRIIHGTVDIGADEASGCLIQFEQFGDGLPGSWDIIPRLSGSTTGCGPAESWLHMTLALGGAPGFLWIGTAEGDYEMFGGRIYVDLGSPWYAVPITFDGLPGWPGAGYLNLPLPNLDDFTGVELFLQALVLDPGAIEGVALTNGLRLEVVE